MEAAALEIPALGHAVYGVAARNRGRGLAVAIQVITLFHEDARWNVQEVALDCRSRGVAVCNVDFKAAQPCGHLAVQATHNSVHHRRERLVGAPLVVRGIHVHANAPFASYRLLVGVWIKDLSRTTIQVDEVDFAVVTCDGDVV